MSQIQLNGALGDKSKGNKGGPVILNRKHRTNVRFINTQISEGTYSSKSSGTLSSFGTSSTPPSLGTSSTPSFVPTSTPSPTIPSIPSSVPISSPSTTPPSIPSSVPTSTPSPTPPFIPSSVPTFTTNVSGPVEQIVGVQQGYSVGSTGPDGRLCIGLWKKELLPTERCSSFISSSFEERVDPDGYNWVGLSNETKLFYWDEFQKNCCWDDAITSKVKTAWETKAKERYSQYTYNMRSTKRNPTRKKPSHISSELWASWNTKWNSEEFKNKSEQNKKNRRKGVADGPALSTHTGGSASHLKIASKMRKRLGRDMTRSELFLYTHTKNHDGTTFIHEKDQKIYDEFKERCEVLEALGEEIDEDKLFYDAVGGHDRKGRLYGFGTYGKAIPSGKGATETCYLPDNNADKERAETKAEIEHLKELIETQREQNDAKCGKLEQQLSQAMAVINSFKEQFNTFNSRG